MEQGYYILPDIAALKTEKDPERLRMHRRRIAANIGDPDTLRALVGDSSEDFHDFYGDSELPQLSTEDTIDSFLDKFGGRNSSSPIESTIPEVPGEGGIIPVVPAIDYASMLEIEERRGKAVREPASDEKSSLTEEFAKIMIKNGNYQRALEIITEISLNNPEKSIYFADQMRFLKKAIYLESKK